MSQLLKKYALLPACAALALCVGVPAVHAQDGAPAVHTAGSPYVVTGGTGEHLLFAYWSIADYMNTHINIHSPVGVRDSGETKNVVRITVRNTEMNMPTKSNVVAAFSICLTPGDSWTASMSGDGLMVVDPGECDGDVHQAADTRSVTNIPTPGEGKTVSLGSATSGWLEAWLRPTGGLNDNTVPCPNPIAAPCGNTNSPGDDDPDVAPDNATPRVISGTASLLSAMSGFSSSYKAVALANCGEQATANAPRMIQSSGDDGDGCWSVEMDATAGDVAREIGGQPIRQALNVRDVLIGRWTAIDDENVKSRTKLVLTFPVNHLNHTAKDIDDMNVPGTDPVSAFIFDDGGMLALSSREVMLDMGVNMCTFMPPADMDMNGNGDGDGDGDGMNGDGMDGDGDGMNGDGDNMGMAMHDMTTISCNGKEIGKTAAMSGNFRIFNNNADSVGAMNMLSAEYTWTSGAHAAPAITATAPADTGREVNNFSISSDTNNTPTVTAGYPRGGQFPDEALNAIGLVLSYFEGTDDKEYDQATALEWVDIDRDAGTGPAGLPDDSGGSL